MGSKVERADEWRRWLAANGCEAFLAMCTGQDSRVLASIDACWHAYGVADDEGQRSIFSAVVDLLRAMQPKCWPLAIELTARAGNWEDREWMARKLKPFIRPDDHEFLHPVADCPRCAGTRGTGPQAGGR